LHNIHYSAQTAQKNKDCTEYKRDYTVIMNNLTVSDHTRHS